MRTLFLLRHGHAEDKENQPDEARNLDEMGRREVEYIGDQMLKDGLRPHLMLSSHASRAYQTAEIIAEKVGYPPKNIQIEKDIYDTGEQSLLGAIQRQDFKETSLLVAGHNPSISRVARSLTGGSVDSMPTAGLLVLECESPNWEDILKYPIRQIAFYKPAIRVPSSKE